MRFSVVPVLILTGAALAIGFVESVPAQGTGPLTADQIIANRQAGQALMGGSFAEMKYAVDTKATDLKRYKPVAEAMGRWMGVFPDLFPPGTEQGHNTKALPAVWSDRSGFDKDARDMVAEAQKLAQAADANDPAAFATAFKDTGAACGACHRNFRAKAS